MPAVAVIGGTHFDNPEDVYIKKEETEEMLSCLSDVQRKVYCLKARYGYPEWKIAEVLGIERGTVKTHWSRAKKKIREWKISSDLCPQNTR